MSSVISSIARTPIGKFGGVFRNVSAVDLGAVAIRAALERAGLRAEKIDEVLFGHVIQAGTGQITSRQAAAKAGIPLTVPATTINKVCLSGMTAIGWADKDIRLGEATFVVAGGMESMTGAPYLLPEGRYGMGYGEGRIIDALEHDGLFCSFDQCTMGAQSDVNSARLGIDRSEQDEWAAASHQRAASASQGAFIDEIVPVEVAQRRGDPVTVDRDEGIRPDSTAETLGALKASFSAEGTITAGNASQISDGAAAVVVADADAADAEGLPVLAEILSYGQIGGVDATLHERPAEALKRALKTADLSPADLDLVEINEAFSGVALWSAKMLDLPHDKVNVNGGAVALGHPLGATGARLIVTLINALRHQGGGIGGASLCGGGGQGDAMIVRVPAP
jgi:acetyl-CoA C-acetyltransferase